METRVDKVSEKHKSGYNCAQAVACAYCDLVVLWKWVVREVKGQLIKYPKKLCADSKRRAAA